MNRRSLEIISAVFAHFVVAVLTISSIYTFNAKRMEYFTLFKNMTYQCRHVVSAEISMQVASKYCPECGAVRLPAEDLIEIFGIEPSSSVYRCMSNLKHVGKSDLICTKCGGKTYPDSDLVIAHASHVVDIITVQVICTVVLLFTIVLAFFVFGVPLLYDIQQSKENKK